MPRVDKTKNFYRVRQKDPELFTETYAVPEWAERVANSVVEGAKVGTAIRKDTGEWDIQTVLIPRKRGRTREDAIDYAEKIVMRIKKSKLPRGKMRVV